ncbi:MAG: hypothetical protein LBB79_04605 [Prevotellaceae bacterium]|nr:hypothetical protein [Prevotellaceae bacterium]
MNLPSLQKLFICAANAALRRGLCCNDSKSRRDDAFRPHPQPLSEGEGWLAPNVPLLSPLSFGEWPGVRSDGVDW